MNKVCIIGSFSPSTFKICQNQSLSIYFVRKVTKGPFEITSCHNQSFCEKFQKFTNWSLNFARLSKQSLELKFWKLSIMVLVLLNFGKNGPWVKSLENLQVQSLEFQYWQIWSLDIQKQKLSTKVLVLITFGKNSPLKILWRVDKTSP